MTSNVLHDALHLPRSCVLDVPDSPHHEISLHYQLVQLL